MERIVAAVDATEVGGRTKDVLTAAAGSLPAMPAYSSSRFMETWNPAQARSAIGASQAELARQRVEVWRLALAETPAEHGELAITVTLSAGVAGFPDHGQDLQTLLAYADADAAMYRSKDAGRNRITCFGE